MLRVKQFFCSIFFILIAESMLIFAIPLLTQPVYSQSSGVCAEQLAGAEQKYNTGRFDEAIGLITECLGKPGISEQEKMKAYRLLGLSYIAKDYLEDAKTAVKKLLDMVPNYQSDPVQDPPPFTKLVEELKQEQPKKPEEKTVEKPKVEEKLVTPPPSAVVTKTGKKGSNKKWYFIGGGVLLAGGAAAILLSGKEDGNGNGTVSFPLPPGRP